MKYESYDTVRVADDLGSFDFVSTGRRGSYLKQVSFEPMKNGEVYQLVFGNLVAENEIDDFSINDNGDRNKILATVALAVNKYTKRYPGRMVYITGSTPSRTRLYRMAIGLNLEELSLTFEIYGETPTRIVPFCKNMEVIGFFVKRKSFYYPFTTI